MTRRRRSTTSLDATSQMRVDATVAAYQAFYGRTGKPCPTLFRTEAEVNEDREAVERIIAEDRAAYAGPLKARQAELAQKRDVHRLPYRMIAEREKLDLEEVRACLGVAGAWYDECEERGAGELRNNPEAWHWSRTERFWEPDPNAVLMRIAEIICPEAVARIRSRVKLGSLWHPDHEDAEMARRFPAEQAASGSARKGKSCS